MSCLYRALSHFHNGIATEQMRHMLCDYLSKNPIIGGERANNIVKWETKKNLSQYVALMRNQSQWGGAIEIKAYCDLFNKNVKVKSFPNNREIEFLSSNNTNDWVYITWNGYHYEPFRSLNKTNHKFIHRTRQFNRPSNLGNNGPNHRMCNCLNCQKKRLMLR